MDESNQAAPAPNEPVAPAENANAPAAEPTTAPEAPAETAPEAETPAEEQAEPAEEAPAAPEAETPAEDAAEPAEETASAPAESTAPAPEQNVGPVSAPGAQVQPVQVKNKLVDLHEKVGALVDEFKGVEVTAEHDVEEVVHLLEDAQNWCVDKLEHYDPTLAETLKK